MNAPGRQTDSSPAGLEPVTGVVLSSPQKGQFNDRYRYVTMAILTTKNLGHQQERKSWGEKKRKKEREKKKHPKNINNNNKNAS